MAEEVSEGKQSEHGREENQSRENGENKEIRKRRRNLQGVVPKDILIGEPKRSFDPTELHQSTIVCGSGKENTGMTVARQTLDAASPVSLMFASIW
jgi:hypothetical protein